MSLLDVPAGCPLNPIRPLRAAQRHCRVEPGSRSDRASLPTRCRDANDSQATVHFLGHANRCVLGVRVQARCAGEKGKKDQRWSNDDT